MSLDFFIGAVLAITAVPFLIFSFMLGKRSTWFVGIAILAKQLGTTRDFLVTLGTLVLFLAFAIGVGMVGSMMLAKGVMMLWTF